MTRNLIETLTELRQRETELEAEIVSITRMPVLEGYWIASAKDAGYDTLRYRLCWFTEERYANGKRKKRRRSIESRELPRIRAQVERGSHLKAARSELEQVRRAIAAIESKIQALMG